MTILICGLIIFFSIHLIPSLANIRADLIEHFGIKRFKISYALTAAVGFITIIVGMIYADYVHLWVPPTWGRHTTIALMLPTMIMVGAGSSATNINRFTRHPMLWGVTLWATAHLLANGDLASVLLFSSFAIYSLFAMWSANHRGAKLDNITYPFKSDIKYIASRVVIYTILLFAHPYFTGKVLIVL